MAIDVLGNYEYLFKGTEQNLGQQFYVFLKVSSQTSEQNQELSEEQKFEYLILNSVIFFKRIRELFPKHFELLFEDIYSSIKQYPNDHENLKSVISRQATSSIYKRNADLAISDFVMKRFGIYNEELEKLLASPTYIAPRLCYILYKDDLKLDIPSDEIIMGDMKEEIMLNTLLLRLRLKNIFGLVDKIIPELCSRFQYN